VAVTTGLHTLCTIASAAPGVFAPVAARDFGLPASQVGIMVALHYLMTLPSGLASAPLQARYGAVRVFQITTGVCALATLCIALAGFAAETTAFAGSASARSLLFAFVLLSLAVLFGLGYGMINPASSQVLFHVSPRELRSLMFSIKQTAVPIGFALAGLIFPLLLLTMRWEWTLVLVAGLLALLTVALPASGIESRAARHPADFSGQLSPKPLIRWSDFTGPMRYIWRSPLMRQRSLMAVAYTARQSAVTAYMISYLNLELGLSLVLAGGVFAFSQFAGVAGRILFGIAADRTVKPRVQLALIGIATAFCSFCVAAMTPAWPVAAITLLCALLGATSMAWNGVFIAETASLAPAGEISSLTGGMQVFIALGALAGPGLYAAIVTAGGSYSLAYGLLGIPPLLVGLKTRVAAMRQNTSDPV
jgi:MFS family permease